MKTTNYNLADVVVFASTCFPFIGLSKTSKLKLRQQHFKRKQHE